jgi:protease-4
VKGLGDQYGVKLETIKSGANKDILSPFEMLTEEQRALLQQVVDEMQERFVSLIVQSRRNMTEAEVRGIADGRVFTARQALEYKVIDEIGYWDDVVARTSELLGVEDVKVYRYSQPFRLSSLLGAAAQSLPMSRSSLERLTGTRITYMWQAW